MRIRFRALTLPIAFSVSILFFSITASALAQNPLRGCLSCHSDPTLTKKVKEKVVPLFIDPLRYSRGFHANTQCSECHLNFALQSPHTKVNQATLMESATVACRDCHEKIYNEYIGSIHGKSLRPEGEASEAKEGKESKKGPSCATCHDVHYGYKYPKALGASQKMTIVGSCGECHEEALEELKGNYHYRALLLGYEKSAGCSDCHQVHATQKMEAGTEEAANGCRKCHPQANKNMAGFLIHTEPESANAPLILKIVLIFMTALTAGTLGLMYFHSFLWFLRKYIEKRRDRRFE